MWLIVQFQKKKKKQKRGVYSSNTLHQPEIKFKSSRRPLTVHHMKLLNMFRPDITPAKEEKKRDNQTKQ
eukprot:scaffold449_cov138-Cylindrotheca_fusiformis.AAC.15